MKWLVLKVLVLVINKIKMKKEIDIFFTAMMFYTRIPCPKNITHDPDYLNKATRYFPLIGWIVGLISGLVFIAFSQILPVTIAVLLSMIASILTTGAFHEDGFADVCDGFGGRWTKEKILMEAKRWKSRSEFIKYASGAYEAAKKYIPDPENYDFRKILHWE